MCRMARRGCAREEGGAEGEGRGHVDGGAEDDALGVVPHGVHRLVQRLPRHASEALAGGTRAISHRAIRVIAYGRACVIIHSAIRFLACGAIRVNVKVARAITYRAIQPGADRAIRVSVYRAIRVLTAFSSARGVIRRRCRFTARPCIPPPISTLPPNPSLPPVPAPRPPYLAPP